MGRAAHRARSRASPARRRSCAAGRSGPVALVSALDLSHLSPDDAIAALRSYPRRFREALTSVDPDDLPDVAVDHADHVARSLALLGEALRQVLVQDNPTLMPAVADDGARDWAHGSGASVDDTLAFLAMEANAIADAAAGAPPPRGAARWGRLARQPPRFPGEGANPHPRRPRRRSRRCVGPRRHDRGLRSIDVRTGRAAGGGADGIGASPRRRARVARTLT